MTKPLNFRRVLEMMNYAGRRLMGGAVWYICPICGSLMIQKDFCRMEKPYIYCVDGAHDNPVWLRTAIVKAGFDPQTMHSEKNELLVLAFADNGALLVPRRNKEKEAGFSWMWDEPPRGLVQFLPPVPRHLRDLDFFVRWNEWQKEIRHLRGGWGWDPEFMPDLYPPFVIAELRRQPIGDDTDPDNQFARSRRRIPATPEEEAMVELRKILWALADHGFYYGGLKHNSVPSDTLLVIDRVQRDKSRRVLIVKPDLTFFELECAIAVVDRGLSFITAENGKVTLWTKYPRAWIGTGGAVIRVIAKLTGCPVAVVELP